MTNKTTNILLAAGAIVTIGLFSLAKAQGDAIQQRNILAQKEALDAKVAEHEKHVQDSIAAVELLASYKDSIQIIKTIASDPNSAGGVDCEIRWKNNTHRTIKYMSFEVAAINAVGDVVPCSIRGYNVDNLKVTGPIKAGQTYGYDTYWDCVWYNHSITKCKVTGYTITFMDGEEVSVTI